MISADADTFFKLHRPTSDTIALFFCDLGKLLSLREHAGVNLGTGEGHEVSEVRRLRRSRSGQALGCGKLSPRHAPASPGVATCFGRGRVRYRRRVLF